MPAIARYVPITTVQEVLEAPDQYGDGHDGGLQ